MLSIKFKEEVFMKKKFHVVEARKVATAKFCKKAKVQKLAKYRQ